MKSQDSGIHHDDIAELLGAYALDALEPDERALVERHLEECPRCNSEVAQHLEVAGFLANSGGEAPPQIWDRISESIGSSEVPNWEKLAARLPKPTSGWAGVEASEPSEPSEDTSEPIVAENTSSKVVSIEQAKRSRFLMRGVSFVASAAALLAIFFGLQVNHLSSKVSQLQAAAKQPLYSQAVQAALEEPSTKRITLNPGGSQGSVAAVTVALTSSGHDYLISKKLSTLPSTKTYQLWGEINGKFVSLGLLGSKPTIIPFVISPNAPVQLFAITAEPSGGVIQPTSSPVVQGKVNL